MLLIIGMDNYPKEFQKTLIMHCNLATMPVEGLDEINPLLYWLSLSDSYIGIRKDEIT